MSNATTHPLTLDDLHDMGACHEAVEWAEHQPDMETAWRTCERADWMIWALAACNADPKRLRLVAADIAEAVLSVWEAKHPEDDRPRKAIEAARALARGEITEEEARAAGAAAEAAAWAAWVAAWDARAAARAARAARAAAAWSAAADAAEGAEDAAWAANDADLAAIVRRHFPDLPTITETTP